MDPTLWSAFERLCKIAPQEVETSKFFKDQHPTITQLNQFLYQVEDSPQQAQKDKMMPPQQVLRQESKEN